MPSENVGIVERAPSLDFSDTEKVQMLYFYFKNGWQTLSTVQLKIFDRFWEAKIDKWPIFGKSVNEILGTDQINIFMKNNFWNLIPWVTMTPEVKFRKLPNSFQSKMKLLT